MGNKQSSSEKYPGFFVAQARTDWENQMNHVLKKNPVIVKTVILPPGVGLDDKRLLQGKVVYEEEYVKTDNLWNDLGDVFETDLEKNLLPRSVKNNGNAHIAVYPDQRFDNIESCGMCAERN